MTAQDNESHDAARGRQIIASGVHAPASGTVPGDPWADVPPPGEPPADAGAELLSDLHEVLLKYVVFPDAHSAIAVTLWITATHALPAFQHAPRLVVSSPQKRCGKSRLLDIIAGTCHSPLMSVNATVAAIYRSIGGDHPPTLLVDEADALFGSKKAAEQNEDLRALLNAGHQRGRPALRCVGPQQTPTEFHTFAMAALAGIGAMPDTITDRAVNLTLWRRNAGERVAQFRERRDRPTLDRMRDRLTRWCAARLAVLSDAEPDMPVEDRAADTWEPLVAIADAAGGRWPVLARAACQSMVAAADRADEGQSLAVLLLADIQREFARRGVSFLSSAELVGALRSVEESPWDDFELNPRKLARRLGEFGVKSERNAAGTLRGYRLEDLTDVFSRYIRPEASEPSETPPEQEKPSDVKNPSDASIRQTDLSVRRKSAPTSGSDVLTDSDDPPGGNGQAEQALAHANASKPAPATPEQNAAYRTGRCRDCGDRPHSAGRTRCDTCHRAHANVMAGYDR